MASLFEDFERYFVAQGVLTTPMFYDTMEADPDFAVAAYEYTGASPPGGIAGVLRSIQIVVRDKSVKTARIKINELYASLEKAGTIIHLTEERWGQITLRQPPFKYQTDERGRTYYCFNLGLNTYYD